MGRRMCWAMSESSRACRLPRWPSNLVSGDRPSSSLTLRVVVKCNCLPALSPPLLSPPSQYWLKNGDQHPPSHWLEQASSPRVSLNSLGNELFCQHWPIVRSGDWTKPKLFDFCFSHDSKVLAKKNSEIKRATDCTEDKTIVRLLIARFVTFLKDGQMTLVKFNIERNVTTTYLAHGWSTLKVMLAHHTYLSAAPGCRPRRCSLTIYH